MEHPDDLGEGEPEMNRAIPLAAILAVTTGAQESIDSLLSASEPSVPVLGTFKSIYAVQGHSVETTSKHVLDVMISHQFGPLQNGPEGGFGLDMACIRIGVDYGFTDWLNVGLERSNDVGKPAAVFLKTRLLRQTTDGRVPLSVTWLSMGFLDTRSDAGLDYSLTLERRFSSLHQLIVARRFMDRFSLQLAPVLVHRNLVPTPDDDGIAFGLGLAGQLQVTPTIALTAEATPMLSGLNSHQDPAAGVGVDIETGGHVFQFRVSNSTWISEDRLYTRSWNAPSLGFNLSRTFNL